jgi:hypothetical protein
MQNQRPTGNLSNWVAGLAEVHDLAPKRDGLVGGPRGGRLLRPFLALDEHVLQELAIIAKICKNLIFFCIGKISGTKCRIIFRLLFCKIKHFIPLEQYYKL